jgi:hypothetical protein
MSFGHNQEQSAAIKERTATSKWDSESDDGRVRSLRLHSRSEPESSRAQFAGLPPSPIHPGPEREIVRWRACQGHHQEHGTRTTAVFEVFDGTVPPAPPKGRNTLSRKLNHDDASMRMKGQQVRMEVTQCMLAVYTELYAGSRIQRFRVKNPEVPGQESRD